MDESYNGDAPISLNVIQEQLKVSRQFVEKAKVKIIKKVHEEEAVVNLPSASEEVQVRSSN